MIVGRSQLHREVGEQMAANARPSDKPMPVKQPPRTVIEALKHMRDTTNSKEQYDRAVEALRQMGVSDE